ncbi:hypothetical protein ONZ43_g7542 [Nemania bipapillata]|uniref:Uncharacterized protein n=1 Tax=Nemania bipapillata TaxID=110536 RepID=A0ACC2HQ20_9PEZI|nr:hypothetical protein ONZ43_g7542 [Nemania bipapillata]
MPSQSHSPPITRCLLVATLFALGFFATISLSNGYVSRSLQKHSPSPTDEPPVPSHEKRLLGLGGILTFLPSDILTPLIPELVSEIPKLLPPPNVLSTQPPDGVPLITGGQASLPLTVLPLPTGAQLGGLVDHLGSLLQGVAPALASGIIATLTNEALGIISSAEAIATDVASLGSQIAHSQVQAPDALSQIGGLIGSLDSKVNDIVGSVASGLSSNIPLPVLQELSQIASSGLENIVKATDGPLSVVGDLIEHNVCGLVTPVDGVLATVAGICGQLPSAVAQLSSELATAPLTNPDVILTGDASAITIFPASSTNSGSPGAITATPTSPAQNSQDQGSLTNPITSGGTGSSSNSAANSAASSPPSGQPPSNGNSATSPLGSQPSPGQPPASASAPGATGEQPPTTIATSPPITGSVQPGGGSSTSQATITGPDGVVTITEYQTTTQPCASDTMQASTGHLDGHRALSWGGLPYNIPGKL